MGVIEIEKYTNTIFLSFTKVYLHYFSSEFWLYNGKPKYVADSLNLNLFNRLIACKEVRQFYKLIHVHTCSNQILLFSGKFPKNSK